MAYPSNVLHLPTECGNRNHSATFPLALPRWFVRLFTDEGARVLDPFVGSGTTSVAARQLRRHSLGVDLLPEYCQEARRRLKKEADADAPLYEEVG